MGVLVEAIHPGKQNLKIRPEGLKIRFTGPVGESAQGLEGADDATPGFQLQLHSIPMLQQDHSRWHEYSVQGMNSAISRMKPLRKATPNRCVA